MQRITQIDKTIHEKARLAIVATLAAQEERTFQDLKGDLGMSDGNLLTHLRMLHNVGYVQNRKILQERVQTCYSLTLQGRDAFQNYLSILASIMKLRVRANKPKNGNRKSKKRKCS